MYSLLYLFIASSLFSVELRF